MRQGTPFNSADIVRKTKAATRRRIYAAVKTGMYEWAHQDPDVEEKAAQRGLTKRNGGNHDEDCPTAWMINGNYARLPKSLRPQVRHINFSLFFNSLGTLSRRSYEDPGRSVTCPMCGEGEDNACHLFVECDIARDSKAL